MPLKRPSEPRLSVATAGAQGRTRRGIPEQHRVLPDDGISGRAQHTLPSHWIIGDCRNQVILSALQSLHMRIYEVTKCLVKYVCRLFSESSLASLGSKALWLLGSMAGTQEHSIDRLQNLLYGAFVIWYIF